MRRRRAVAAAITALGALAWLGAIGRVFGGAVGLGAARAAATASKVTLAHSSSVTVNALLGAARAAATASKDVTNSSSVTTDALCTPPALLPGGRLPRRTLAPPGRRFLLLVSTDCAPERRLPASAWIAATARERSYDVALIDYSPTGACRGHVPGVDSVFPAPASFKFPGIHALLSLACPGLVGWYDYIGLMDDDITVRGGVQAVETLFFVAATARYYAAQPALSHASFASHPVTLRRGHGTPHNARDVRFVEVQMPVLCRAAVTRFLGAFNNVTHAWGLDAAWSAHATSAGLQLGVVDAVVVEHARRIGGGQLYNRLGGAQWRREGGLYREYLAYLRAHGLRVADVDAARTDGRRAHARHVNVSGVRGEAWYVGGKGLPPARRGGDGGADAGGAGVRGVGAEAAAR